MKNKNVHYDKIVAKAGDMSLPVWCWNPIAKYWMEIAHSRWEQDCIYAVGDKPTSPPPEPRKTCTLGGVTYPAPETVAPARGTTYYIPALSWDEPWTGETWYDNADHHSRLSRSLVHLDIPSARAHGLALLEACLQAVMAAT